MITTVPRCRATLAPFQLPAAERISSTMPQASFGTFNNHPAREWVRSGLASRIFQRELHGGPSYRALLYNNLGGVTGAPYGGSTEFYDTATAGAPFFTTSTP